MGFLFCFCLLFFVVVFLGGVCVGVMFFLFFVGFCCWFGIFGGFF